MDGRVVLNHIVSFINVAPFRLTDECKAVGRSSTQKYKVALKSKVRENPRRRRPYYAGNGAVSKLSESAEGFTKKKEYKLGLLNFSACNLSDHTKSSVIASWSSILVHFVNSNVLLRFGIYL